MIIYFQFIFMNGDPDPTDPKYNAKLGFHAWVLYFKIHYNFSIQTQVISWKLIIHFSMLSNGDQIHDDPKYNKKVRVSCLNVIFKVSLKSQSRVLHKDVIYKFIKIGQSKLKLLKETTSLTHTIPPAIPQCNNQVSLKTWLIGYIDHDVLKCKVKMHCSKDHRFALKLITIKSFNNSARFNIKLLI